MAEGKVPEFTTGDLERLINKREIPDNSPLFAMVYDLNEPSGESRVRVTDIRLEIFADGAACMVFDTEMPEGA